MRLQYTTPNAWAEVALAGFDSFLLDHASCERKASGAAMSLVAHYPDKQALVRAMIDLAREELEHFALVYARLERRGLVLAPDTKDPYIGRLAKLVRGGREAYLLDRLLVAGVVEARGCERFGLVAEALPEGAMRDFYRDLTRSEARHHALFVRVAREYYSVGEVDARLAEILAAEAEVAAQLPWRAAVH